MSKLKDDSKQNLSVTMRGIELMMQWRNRHTKHFALSFQLPQIISGLCVEPRGCTFAEYQLKTQCHFSRYARFGIDQLAQTFTRNVQVFCRLRDAQTKRFKPQFLQHFTWVWRVKLFHRFALVVIQVIDNINVAVFKSKTHTPICLNSDCPQFGFFTLQRMQAQRGGIDVIKTLGIVKQRQNQVQFFSMNGLNTSLIASRIKLFQAFVCETFNHILDYNLTGYKIPLTQTTTPTKMTAPRNIEGGRENPFITGDKPHLLAVFFCPSFLSGSILSWLSNIMMGLFEQPLRLVVPVSGILTSFNPVTNTVRSISVGYPTLTGITA